MVSMDDEDIPGDEEIPDDEDIPDEDEIPAEGRLKEEEPDTDAPAATGQEKPEGKKAVSLWRIIRKRMGRTALLEGMQERVAVAPLKKQQKLLFTGNVSRLRDRETQPGKRGEKPSERVCRF